MNSEADEGKAGGDSGIEDKAEQGLAGDSAENPVANENETGISEETDSSDFDVENNESENKEDKVEKEDGVVSPEDTDDDGARETRPYDEEPEEDESETEESETEETETEESETETSKHETREYDEEFGPKQEESETSESETSEEETSESEDGEGESDEESTQSEISESETSETDTTETRPHESTQSEIVEEEKIATASDIEETTMPELKPVKEIASESDTKLFGAVPNIGDTFYFGFYPQSTTNYNIVEPIKWIVHTNSSNYTYVVSDKILDRQQYHNEYKNTTAWTTTTLYTWVTNTFRNKAFTESENSMISGISILGYRPESIGDKIIGYGTTYAKSRNLAVDSSGASMWWLQNDRGEGKSLIIATMIFHLQMLLWEISLIITSIYYLAEREQKKFKYFFLQF